LPASCQNSIIPSLRKPEYVTLTKTFILMCAKFFDAHHAEAAREILEKKFHQKITSLDLADEIGIGEKTLKRAFKRYYGINIFSYQVQLRMGYARDLLMRGDKSVKQVARMVGYSGQSSFSRTFIRYFGTAPSLWIGLGIQYTG
jgi:AraC-like DNA-binding protein